MSTIGASGRTNLKRIKYLVEREYKQTNHLFVAFMSALDSKCKEQLFQVMWKGVPGYVGGYFSPYK